MIENKKQGIENILKDVTLITPEIFKNAMNEIFSSCKDPSTSNAELDYAIFEGASLMCATLRMAGYKEGVDIFEQLCRLTRRKEQGAEGSEQ